MARFDEIAANSGVDTLKDGDTWVIVPHGGDNHVFLRDGTGYSFAVKSEGGFVQCTNLSAPGAKHPPVITSSPRGKNDLLLRFTAQRKGLGRIVGTNARQTVSIPFSVHPKVTHKISFFFLQDLVGREAKRRTTFPESCAADWVKDLNRVFGPQANLWFEAAKAVPLPLAGLSQVISVADAPLLETKKNDSLINIFLAGAHIKGNESDFPNGFYAIKEKLIVLKDQAASDSKSKPMLKTMAHEIAHLLNYHRSASTPGHEYYKKCGYLSDVLNTMDGTDIKIPHQRVLDWNPW